MASLPLTKRVDALERSGIEANIFYNGSCPICRTEIEHYLRLDRRHGQKFDFIDIAGAEHVCPFDRTEMLKRLHVVERDGTKHVGVDAFIQIWQRLPYYHVLAAIARQSWARALAVPVYDRVLAPLLFKYHLKREAKKATKSVFVEPKA